MTTAPTTAAPPRPSAVEANTPMYVRKAWRVLIGSFLVFTLLFTGAGLGIGAYWWKATRPQVATVELITAGGQASVRPRQQTGFKVLDEGSTVGEGDTVRTPQNVRVTLRLFNQTRVELSGGTEILIEQLRTQQYVNRRATVILKQLTGRAIITTGAATATGFAATNLEVRTNTGGVEARQPGTKFRVLVMPAGDARPETTSVSVLGGGAVTVAGTGDVRELTTVGNGQQSTVALGAAPSPAEVKQRDLVLNGGFPFDDAAEMGKPSSHWIDISKDGGDGRGATRGRAEVVTELVRGQPTKALRLVREGGNVDNDQVGFSQQFPFGELDEFDSVTLTADVKVVSHNLSAGGEQGSEFPMILLLRYHDPSGEKHDHGQAFYTQNDANYRTKTASSESRQVRPGVWEQTFRWELRSLTPAPYRLISLDVYASGHDFDAYVANISIVAK